MVKALHAELLFTLLLVTPLGADLVVYHDLADWPNSYLRPGARIRGTGTPGQLVYLHLFVASDDAAVAPCDAQPRWFEAGRCGPAPRQAEGDLVRYECVRIAASGAFAFAPIRLPVNRTVACCDLVVSYQRYSRAPGRRSDVDWTERVIIPATHFAPIWRLDSSTLPPERLGRVSPVAVEFVGGTPPWSVLADWGDGRTDHRTTRTRCVSVEHTYLASGTWNARFCMTDACGLRREVSTTLWVGYLDDVFEVVAFASPYAARPSARPGGTATTFRVRTSRAGWIRLSVEHPNGQRWWLEDYPGSEGTAGDAPWLSWPGGGVPLAWDGWTVPAPGKAGARRPFRPTSPRAPAVFRLEYRSLNGATPAKVTTGQVEVLPWEGGDP